MTREISPTEQLASANETPQWFFAERQRPLLSVDVGILVELRS